MWRGPETLPSPQSPVQSGAPGSWPPSTVHDTETGRGGGGVGEEQGDGGGEDGKGGGDEGWLTHPELRVQDPAPTLSEVEMKLACFTRECMGSRRVPLDI